MLDLNSLRAAFAAHLSADPLRFSMDKALAHVCQMAYQRGLKDGAKDGSSSHSDTSALRKDAERYRWLRTNDAHAVPVSEERRGYRSTSPDARREVWCVHIGWSCSTLPMDTEYESMDVAIDTAMSLQEQAGNNCRHCGGPMSPGIAMAQTVTGSPDFPGAEGVTMSPGGPGKLIDCLKCEACGWSVGT